MKNKKDISTRRNFIRLIAKSTGIVIISPIVFARKLEAYIPPDDGGEVWAERAFWAGYYEDKLEWTLGYPQPLSLSPDSVRLYGADYFDIADCGGTIFLQDCLAGDNPSRMSTTELYENISEYNDVNVNDIRLGDIAVWKKLTPSGYGHVGRVVAVRWEYGQVTGVKISHCESGLGQHSTDWVNPYTDSKWGINGGKNTKYRRRK